MKLYMFRTVPLSVIRSFSLYTQQWYMSYRFADSLQTGSGCFILIPLASYQQTFMTHTIAVCTAENSWWWTEELSRTCRVLFQEKIWEISASIWFYYKKFIMMHCHMNVRKSYRKVGCVCVTIRQELFVTLIDKDNGHL